MLFISALCSYLRHILSPSLKKFKKNPPPKKLLTFRGMGLFGSNNKIFFIVSSISGNGNHKKIIYILGNRNPKKLLIFQKMELLGPSSKNKKNPP